MLSLLEFKRILSEEGEQLSDSEVQALRDSLYQMADIAYNCWVRDKPKNTSDFGLID